MMKKNLVRLLSVILAAVMVFPAAAFAAGDPIAMFTGSTYDLKNELTDEQKALDLSWSSLTTDIVSVGESTGVVTALKAGTGVVKAYDKGDGYKEIGSFTIKVSDDELKSVAIATKPIKLSYVENEALDTTGLTLTATYASGPRVIESGFTVNPKDPTVDKSAMKAGTHTFVVTYNGVTNSDMEFTVTVTEKQIYSITILSDKTEFEVGDLISNLTIRVNYDNGTFDDKLSTSSDITITLNGKTTPNRKLVEGDTSYWVSYKGFYDHRDITVTPKSSEGGGGGGGSDTPTADYTLSYLSGPTLKTYTVGDTLNTAGLEIYVKNNKTNTTTKLTGANLEVLEYKFTATDISATNTTTTITIRVVFNNTIYEVKVPGLTVKSAKDKLDLSAYNDKSLKNVTFEMARKSYPVGTTFKTSDIGMVVVTSSSYSRPLSLFPDDFDDYDHTFSLEVLTRRQSSYSGDYYAEEKTSKTYRSTIESNDVFTDSNGRKYVYLRLYIDEYFTDIDVDCGDTGIYVYASSTSTAKPIGYYDSLEECLRDVNDLDFEWDNGYSSSASRKYNASSTLYVQLNEDAELRYNDLVRVNRTNTVINLNGHKLTLRERTFTFPNNSTAKVTVQNNATDTAKVVYSGTGYDELLIDKGESIVFNNETTSSNLPGIYTITVEEVKNGAVTSKPAMSNRNIITVSHGSDVTFTISPDKNYEIDAVKTKAGTSSSTTTVSSGTTSGYDVNKTTGIATYTMKDIKSNMTLTATFKAVKAAEEPKKEETTPWTNPFTDVNSYASYYDAVKYVNQNGLMNGMTATTFGPNQTMTRAQFVTTLGRMYLGSIFQTTAEKDAAMIAQYGTDSQFSDVSYNDASLSYAVPYIKWAESSGLVLGYGNGKFGPKDTITHQQMYIIMYRYAQSLANKSINVNNVTLTASDASELGAGWLASARDGAIAAAKYAQQQHFLVSTSRIDPSGNALRYELALLLQQFSMNVLGWE